MRKLISAAFSSKKSFFLFIEKWSRVDEMFDGKLHGVWDIARTIFFPLETYDGKVEENCKVQY